MEFLHVSTSQVSSRISFINPKPSIQFPSNTNSYRFRKSNLLYRTCFPAPHHCKGFYISAQFGRRTLRRNSLRRKLKEDLHLRRKIPPSPNFEHRDANTQSSLVVTGNEVVRQRDDESSEIRSGPESSPSSEGASESVLWNKLEGWVEQYKNDIEFWGLGSGSIFTVHQDLDGNVKRILVDEDEIVRRSRIQPSDFRDSRESDEFDEVRSKIAYARFVADEMEKGNHLLTKNSSVAKFVVSEDDSKVVSKTRSDSSGLNFIPTVSKGTMSGFSGSKSGFIPIVSRLGIIPLCGLILVWAVKKFFSVSEGEKELTRLEKEMLRRKMKSREKTAKFEDGCVEVVPEVVPSTTEIVERPSIDKEELMNSIKAAMQSDDQEDVLEVAGISDTASMNMEGKIQEIRDMARHAREAERQNSPSEQPLIEVEAIQRPEDTVLDASDNLLSESLVEAEDTDDTEEREAENGIALERKDDEGILTSLGTTNDSSNVRGESSFSKEVTRKKLRVIRSVKEAREFLSGKHNLESGNGDAVDSHLEEGSDASAETSEDTKITSDIMGVRSGECVLSDASDLSFLSNNKASVKDSSDHEQRYNSFHPQVNGMNGKAQSLSVQSASAVDSEKSDSSCVDTTKNVIEDVKISDAQMPEESIQTSELALDEELCHDHSPEENLHFRTDVNGESTAAHITSSDKNTNFGSSHSADLKETLSGMVKPASSSESSYDSEEEQPVQVQINGRDVSDRNLGVEESISEGTSEVPEECEESLKIEAPKSEGNWLEKNFDELLPVFEKMSTEFSNSYSVASEKVKLEPGHGPDLMELRSVLTGNTELEWMNDDKLRKIVFKVRDNELAGRDPFYSMDVEDKMTFFQGLEQTAERESGKLSVLHEWLHSNIENLDYGADGISVYDPPEKVVPRWKGAPFDQIREFLANTPETQEGSRPDKAKGFLADENLPVKSNVGSTNKKTHTDVAKSSKTVIESSDGSVKPGKKTGKEQWQHTKKHTRGFLEVYNAETDPEIKEIMRNMGKDLDRWITEEEIQKAAALKGKLRRRGQAFVEKKLNKLKGEVERFGQQAVLHKYREYAVDKEEDYLWWLDLPYVLCIEMYTHEGDKVKVGFYALEMAADLELDPKPRHVIAFEDPGDCKNLCYIIQSHLEMLGKGDKAFVVAQPPKEAFRDAKANGFGVSVIRRGELPMNVDQPLEEVEEQISEIGSKMYHDKITKERSIDIRSVMKGLLATSKPTRRKNMKRRRKKPKK